MPAPTEGYDDAAELYLEPIVGLRLFGVNQQDYSSVELTSIHQPYVWMPGVNENFCQKVNEYYTTELSPIAWSELYSEDSITAEVATTRILHKEQQGYTPHDLYACSCGFYAYHSHRYLSQYSDYNFIVGAVAGTGRTMLGTKGFRAERAQILGLSTRLLNNSVHPDYLNYALRGNYPGVPLFKSTNELREAFPPTYLDKFPEEEYRRS